jgi:hypothetical protein
VLFGKLIAQWDLRASRSDVAHIAVGFANHKFLRGMEEDLNLNAMLAGWELLRTEAAVFTLTPAQEWVILWWLCIVRTKATEGIVDKWGAKVLADITIDSKATIILELRMLPPPGVTMSIDHVVNISKMRTSGGQPRYTRNERVQYERGDGGIAHAEGRVASAAAAEPVFGACFRCGKPGHHIAQCRSRQTRRARARRGAAARPRARSSARTTAATAASPRGRRPRSSSDQGTDP